MRQSLRNCLALSLGLLLASGAVLAKPSNKWRLEFSGAAESPGEIVLRVQPVGGEPVDVTVAIEGNDGENRVAGKVRDALKAALKADYRIDRDDGEDVLVKRRWGRPPFEVSLASSTVKDVRINFDRE
ncbi:hypothetical protein [Arenimonas sp.]|uniref:hypothetical protein n=1 Tax=Arenimonas sp. TaxID=1872635 RepID=UPI0025C228CA|nr:hypothetical protein [Arenimonas sp.]